MSLLFIGYLNSKRSLILQKWDIKIDQKLLTLLKCQYQKWCNNTIGKFLDRGPAKALDYDFQRSTCILFKHNYNIR